MEKTEFFSAFDKALPTHIKALYADLLRVYNKADSLFSPESMSVTVSTAI
jgi:hypothetical protein